MTVYLANVSNSNLQKERSSIVKYLEQNRFLVEANFFNFGKIKYWLFYDLSLSNLLKILFLFLLRKKMVYYCHEPKKRMAELQDYTFKEKLKSFIVNFIHPLIFRCVDTIVTLSPVGSAKVSEFWRDKLVETRIIIEDVEHTFREIEYDICWLGKCSRQKGFDRFIVLVESNLDLKVCICTNDDKEFINGLFTKTTPDIVKYENEDTATDLLSKSKFAAIMHTSLTQSGVAVEALRSDCYLLSDNNDLKYTYKGSGVVCDTKTVLTDFNIDMVKDGRPRRVYLDNHHPSCHEFLLNLLR